MRILTGLQPSGKLHVGNYFGAMEPAVRRLTLRLIVGGKLDGAKCSYNWVRFIKRENLAYLQEVPDLQTVVSNEPLGDSPVKQKNDRTQR